MEKPGTSPRRKTGGMTLVELLLGIGVLVLSGVWLLGAYHSSLHLTETAQQTKVALNDLRDMMERIKATPFTRLDDDFPNGAPDGMVGAGPNRYTAVVGGYSLPNERITVTHTPDPAADPRELVVQITWTNRGRAYQRSVATVRASEAS